MIECICEKKSSIKGNYTYKRKYAYDVHEYELNKKSKKSGKYIYPFLTFDIETSDYFYNNGNDYETFMYIWQVCIEDDVIFGRTWGDFFHFLRYVYKKLKLKKEKIVVYVHNLSYEWQFMKMFFNWENVFAMGEHTVLKCSTDKFEFRCSYKLSNMSLAKYMENTEECEYMKATGDLDYSKFRTPKTELTPIEYGYCYNDVAGLWQCVNHNLQEDDLSSIPLTSTGYVRRDCRNAMRKNKKNRIMFQKSRLTLKQYDMMIEAFRGGNTASNRYYTNRIIANVFSYDISSSYPYVLMAYKYPTGKFMYASINDRDELLSYNHRYATIGRYTLVNVRLKDDHEPIPYIALFKSNKISSEREVYNGRVMSCEYINLTLTNIDFKIIDDMYEYDEMYVEDFYFSRTEYLSKELREVILKYFKGKTELKGIDEQYYYYMKSKNKLNAIYGMMVTALIRDEYDYHDGVLKLKENVDREKKLDDYYRSRNSFLTYQHGIWCTAYARMRFQELINKNKPYIVYGDTDSNKLTRECDDIVNAINQRVIEHEHDVNVPYHCNDRKGNDVYMGIWDKEKSYDQFITMGAKKYAFMQDGELGVTVSGLNKKNAPKELQKLGGLEMFKEGTIFYDSGRTSAHYVDCGLHTLIIGDEHILTGSYVTLIECEYTLGITESMLEIIDKNQKNN